MFDRLNIKAVCLANNHVNDISENFESTIKELTKNGIAFFGAGRTEKEARRPAIICENRIDYAILGFGWKVIGCRKNKDYDLIINQLEEDNVLSCIEETEKCYPHCRIILFFHWDYELEIYPQPLHRIIAHKAIDAGAYAIIGSHPHCVQPVEIYKDHLIAYSLGNFTIPNGYYMNRKLSYPERARDEMVIEINASDFRLLHFKYDGDNTISMLEDYSIEDSKAEFSDMDAKSYLSWFKKHRVKKKMLPIFKNSSAIANGMKFEWIKGREKAIRYLLKMNIKSGPT